MGLTEVINYVFKVIIGIIGGPLINIVLKVYFDVLGQRTKFVLCLLNFRRHKRKVTELVNYVVVVFISIIG